MTYKKQILRKTLAILVIVFSIALANADDVGMAINNDKSTPNDNAMLDIKSPVTGAGKGLLIPRITQVQRTTTSAALSGGLLDDSGDLRGAVAAQGLLIYQTDGTQGFYYNTSITITPTWVYLGSGDGTVTSVATGTGLTGGPITGSGTVSITNGGVTETQLNTSVAGDALTGGGGTALAVGVDDTTIEISADALQTKDSGATAGTYKSVTVDVKGRVTAASNPTTLAGFGITDATVPARSLTAGNGLTGGGDLSANRTLTIGDGAGLTVNLANLAVNVDDSTIEINGGDNLQVKANGITSANIASAAATNSQILTADGSGGTAWVDSEGVPSSAIIFSETPVNADLSAYTLIGKVDCDTDPKTGTNATSTWTATSITGAPPARDRHSTVWTGSEMIIWGGRDSTTKFNSGARYNPTTNSWTTTSMTNAPSIRSVHTAVWTGCEMIVWGGYDSGLLNTGGRYNPTTDTWIATSIGINLPLARDWHTAIWTGNEMIVWGGQDGGGWANSGGRYNPISDSWTPTSTGVGVPPARRYHSAIWTGNEMIVWGGQPNGGGFINSGGCYNPETNSWTTTSMTNAPEARGWNTTIWTGSEMIVWGGHNGTTRLNSGGRYNPITNSWIATSIGGNVPMERNDHTAIWTGSEMIIWGGYGNTHTRLATGGRYNPITNSWVATSTGVNVPSGRTEYTSVWTGSKMIVWGGYDVTLAWTNTGGCLAPSGYSSYGLTTNKSFFVFKKD